MNEGRVHEVDEGAGVQEVGKGRSSGGGGRAEVEEVGKGQELRRWGRRICSGGGGWERHSVHTFGIHTNLLTG